MSGTVPLGLLFWWVLLKNIYFIGLILNFSAINNYLFKYCHPNKVNMCLLPYQSNCHERNSSMHNKITCCVFHS